MKAATLDDSVGILHLSPWKSTMFWVLLTSLLPLTAALQWTDSPTNYTKINSCSNNDIDLPGSFTLSPGETVTEITWMYRRENGTKDVLAIYIGGHFNPMPAYTDRLNWTGQAGMSISQAAGPRSGNYSVVVKTWTDSKFVDVYYRTITVEMADPPTAKNGQLTVRQESEAVYDNTTGEWKVQLTCGVLTDPGRPAVSPIWTTPEGNRMESSSQDNGTFSLLLPNPPSDGNYTCTLPPLSPAKRCLPPLSPLLEGASVTVDKVKVMFTLSEVRLRAKAARQREMQALLDAKIKEQEAKNAQQEEKDEQQEAKINQQVEKNEQQEAKIKQQVEKNEEQEAKINQQEEKIKQQDQELMQVKSELEGAKNKSAMLLQNVLALQARLVRHCADARRHNNRSGVVTVYPDNHTPLQVYCDQDTDGGGWLVFQRRQDDSVDFYKNWTPYQKGFGDVRKSFWLGLDALYMLTSKMKYELRVDLMKFDGTKGYVTYSDFSVSDSSDKYRLSLKAMTGGNAGDSLLLSHAGQQFSTVDADHDNIDGNCAKLWHGAWWYKGCHFSNLNGRYRNKRVNNADGVTWNSFDTYHSLKLAEMKLRPLK